MPACLPPSLGSHDHSAQLLRQATKPAVGQPGGCDLAPPKAAAACAIGIMCILLVIGALAYALLRNRKGGDSLARMFTGTKQAPPSASRNMSPGVEPRLPTETTYKLGVDIR
jgi:hypothetical protein